MRIYDESKKKYRAAMVTGGVAEAGGEAAPEGAAAAGVVGGAGALPATPRAGGVGEGGADKQRPSRGSAKRIRDGGGRAGGKAGN